MRTDLLSQGAPAREVEVGLALLLLPQTGPLHWANFNFFTFGTNFSTEFSASALKGKTGFPCAEELPAVRAPAGGGSISDTDFGKGPSHCPHPGSTALAAAQQGRGV